MHVVGVSCCLRAAFQVFHQRHTSAEAERRTHLHIAKDVVALRLEVVLHEGLLPAAVPQVEHQVSQESHVGVLDVNRRAEPHGVSGEVVGKDYTPHGGLAAAALAHQ